MTELESPVRRRADRLGTDTKPPISGLVITFNEADRIGDCLRSMRPVCQQLIVLDAGSTDGTADVARRAGAEVVVCEWQGFTQQRNRALELAAHPWALFLDADERVSPELAREILSLFESASAAQDRLAGVDGFDMRFRTCFLGNELRFGASVREHHVRLFRTTLRYRQRRVHEYLLCEPHRIEKIAGYVLHDTARDYAHYQSKLARYATLLAADRADAGRQSSFFNAWIRAGFFWLKNYWMRAGFLDGLAGYLYHRLHAEYVFGKHIRLFEHNLRASCPPEAHRMRR
jgi:(heptosyl)LPS beta-1,4-glucosyltransferase